MMDMPIICTRCNGESPSNAQFCIECGEAFAAATGPTTLLKAAACPHCNAELHDGARFCVVCGQSLDGGVAAQRAPQPQPTPWPQPQTHAQPRAQRAQRPPLPAASQPAQVYPRVHVPSAPLPQPAVAPAHRKHHKGDIPLSKLIFFGGLAFLLFTKALFWPAILIVLGLTFIAHQAERGRFEDGLRTAFIFGAIWLVATHPRFWPALLIIFIASRLFGRGRSPW